MQPEGDAPVTSPDESKVSTPHTVEEEGHPLPPEGFPYIGSIVISVHRELPPNYVSLAQMVSGTPSASSLYHNPVLESGAMPTTGFFITNLTSQQAFTSVPVEPTIPNPLVSSIPVTVWFNKWSRRMSLSVLQSPPVSGQVLSSSGGQNLSVSMVSAATNVSSSQAHMVGMNQPSFGIIQNPTGPARSSNVQYQQVQNPVGPSGQEISSTSSLMRLRFNTCYRSNMK